MNYGLDLLGLARFDREVVQWLARNWPKGWWLGVFSKVDGFGDARRNAKTILQGGRVGGIRIQGAWRDNHDFRDYTVDEALFDAASWEEVLAAFPSVRAEYSFACEHNIAKPDRYHDAISNRLDRFTCVNVPFTGAASKKYKNEAHGTKPAYRGRYNFSFDGTDCVNVDMRAYKGKHRKSQMFYFWTPQFNGRKSTNDPTPRKDRDAWPSVELIESITYLANPIKGVKLPRRFLWKSHAEQHNIPASPRELKPVLIAPIKVDEFVLKRNGKKVADLEYYDTFVDGRYRYYLKEWGYKLSARAKNAPFELWANGKQYGTVNPAFRGGEFR